MQKRKTTRIYSSKGDEITTRKIIICSTTMHVSVAINVRTIIAICLVLLGIIILLFLEVWLQKKLEIPYPE